VTSARPLAGRVAIVTGSSQGFGLEVARAYVDAGAQVMLCARDAALVEQRRREIADGASGDAVAAEAVDVTQAPAVDRLVEATLKRFGALHILVNNAGVYGPMGTIESVDWVEWTRAMEINLYGSILPARAVLPHFKRAGHGKIIQVSGGGATNPMPRLTA